MLTTTIKCGDSFSIWLKLKTGQTFPLNTNMLVYIGGVLIGNLDTGIPLITYESPYYKMNLSSEDTFPMRGYRDVIVVFDGTDGVRQVIIAGILFERLPTDYQTPTTNDGVNMIIELDVSTSPVTGSAELIDALKGDKGDPGYGVLPIDGAPGQVITKLSYTEQDAGWRTPIQLGETSADSYRGDRGKIAYDHSQTPHAPADAEKNVNADWDSVSGDSQILNKPTIPSIVGLATTVYVDQQDAFKVDKIAGKQLSTNDYTVAEKDKLTAIQAGAHVNILEGVQRNGTNLTIIDKKVNVIVPTTPSEVGAEPANLNIQSHISSTSNPHLVTKAQVGLGSADDTSDANKPVSIAQKAALDLKQTVFTGICQEQFLTENDIIIDNTVMTLTIATVKNGQTISALNPICFYTDGNGISVKHEKPIPVVFNFTNTDGVWYFYFDSTGNPIATQTSWSDFSTIASVYRFYWNSSLSIADRRVIESIEYHKNDISWSDHVWKHSEGTKYLSGFNISHNATVSATPNINGSNAVVTLSSGSNIDDNMEYSVTHAASGTVKFTQNLGTGILPATSGKFICISNDASLKLQKIPATDFPFLWNPTTNIPQYLTSTGVRTDVGNGNFFVYYIYALQDPRYGEAIKIKSAETDFASSTLAAAHNWEQLQAIFPTLRDGEIRLLYKLTFEYKSAYDIGTKKAALRVVDDLRKQKTTTTATAGGLLPATSVVVSPIGNIASTNVQSALQELDSEKQPVGTYSTDIHSNIAALNLVSGANTGDETTSSIKTKLGVASTVNSGYLANTDWAIFNTKQDLINGLGFVKVNGTTISYDNSTYEPAFSKNTGFNKNFGTTAGTVLEGRTFGTAASSAVGDFQPIENQRLSTTNSPVFKRIDVNNTFGGLGIINIDGSQSGALSYSLFNSLAGIDNSGFSLYENTNSRLLLGFNSGGNAQMYGTVNSTGFLLNGNNLTSSLTTNYIPKWNGSNFVNSASGDFPTLNQNTTGSAATLTTTRTIWGQSFNGSANVSGAITGATTGNFSGVVTASSFSGSGSNLTGVQLPITLTTTGTSGAATFSGNTLNVPNYSSSGSFVQLSPSSAQTGSAWLTGDISSNANIYSSSCITEQLNINSSGTSSSVAGTSGTVTFNMPFRGISYKKIIIGLFGFAGNVNWSYPTAFTNTPVVLLTDGLSSSLITSKSTTSVTVTSASALSGILILEGY